MNNPKQQETPGMLERLRRIIHGPPARPAKYINNQTEPIANLFQPTVRGRRLSVASENQERVQAQDQSLFLGRLPLDLRLQIYELVFGHRPVLIRIAAQHPWKDGEILEGYTIEGFGFTPARVRDVSQAKRWGWYHMICRYPVCDDSCGAARDRKRYGIEREEKKLDVALLYTCRQIYSEGIRLLYHTTKFHIDDDTIVLHLPEFFLPQRLPLLTSLEFNWYFRFFPSTQAGKRRYDEVWAALSSLKLRTLSVTMHTWTLPQPVHDEPAPDLEAIWLKPVDELVRKTGPRLQQLTLRLPASYFDVLKTLQPQTEVLPVPNTAQRWCRFRRVVDAVPAYWICSNRESRLS